jgi:hypothetical protein
MTQLELIETLHSRGLKYQLADNGAVLCQLPGLGEYGVGITPLGEWLDCYCFETYAGGDIGLGGFKTLSEVLTWASLLIASFDCSVCAELALMKGEI